MNAVLPDPIWTLFIPAGMDDSAVETFGSQVPFGRPGQPAELASSYVHAGIRREQLHVGRAAHGAGGMPVF